MLRVFRLSLLLTHSCTLLICRKTIQLWLKQEIIHYPMAHQQELESLPSFVQGGTDLVSHWKQMFHRRIIQHNLRVVSVYYQRLSGTRLAQLLQLSGERLETELADMVSAGDVYAKMDRPKDIVRFCQKPSPEETLSGFASDLDRLLHLVETTTHLIHKENMTSSTTTLS